MLLKSDSNQMLDLIKCPLARKLFLLGLFYPWLQMVY